MLPIREYGERGGVPIVLIAGLFGEGKNLGAVARTLSANNHVFTIDLRNHGTAPWSDEHNYFEMAKDVIETFSEFEQIDLMGHSMGGKAAMMVALLKPNFIRKLLIADIAPVNYTHDHDGLIDGMLALDLTSISNRREADVALSKTIPESGVRAFLLHGLKFGEHPKWQNNLVVLKKSMAEIVGWPDVHGIFTGATLFVGGANSDYIQPEHRESIKYYFPNALITHIKDAGHWLHVEQPRIFAKIVNDFFGD